MRPPRSVTAPVAAVVCLVGGYADLVLGGVTIGPALLVLGYCAAVPAALLMGGRLGRG